MPSTLRSPPLSVPSSLRALAILALLLPVLLGAPARADEPAAPAPASAKTQEPALPWFFDVKAAKAVARAEGKDFFLLFTGSDWCAWCKRLDAEVLSTELFVEDAHDRFVYLFLDFPSDRPSGEAARGRVVDPDLNESLREKYGVTGFPTVILTDPEGRPYGRTGFLPGGPESYLAHLDELTRGAAAVSELHRVSEAEPEKTTAALEAAIPVLIAQDLLAYPDYRAYEKAAAEVETLAGAVRTDRARRELVQLLSSKEPAWDRIHEILRDHDLSGPTFLTAAWAVANERLAASGDHAGAIALLRRMLADPLVAEDAQGREQIERRIAELESQAKAPR